MDRQRPELLIAGEVIRFITDGNGALINGHIFSIKNIAYSLAHTYRYNNLHPKFYSVALHCVNACNLYDLLTADSDYSDETKAYDKMAILLHDCGEMIIGDILKPLRDLFCPELESFENAVVKWLVEGMKLPYDKLFLDEPRSEIVKDIDMLIFKQEIIKFGVDTSGFEQNIVTELDIETAEQFKLLENGGRADMSPTDAQRFLSIYNGLIPYFTNR